MAKKSNAKQVAKQLAKALDKVVTKKNMKLIGNKTIEIIVDRTRGEGKGVKNQFGYRKTLKKVSPKYAIWRQSQARHPDAANGMDSNLTFSGEMLDRLKLTKLTKDFFNIGWSDKKNQDKARNQSAQGREFIRLAKSEVTTIIKFISDLYKKDLGKV